MKIENRNTWIKSDSEGLAQTISKANRLFDRVTSTQEATLDSKLLLRVSNMSVEMVSKMKLSSKVFDLEDFVARIKASLNSVGNNFYLAF
jgi:hypothetical protein